MPTSSPTGAQHGWASVAHGTTTIKKVTDVNFSQGGQLTPFFGDATLYPQIVMAHSGKITAQVHSADEATLMGIAFGTVASLTATHKDALGVSGGDVVYTMANAIAGACTASGPYGSYGKAQLTFEGFSSDGTTNPLAITRT